MLTERQNLKIEIFTQGIRPSQKARAAIAGMDGKPLSTGDYASTNGIVLNIGEHIYVNAPLQDNNPNFVTQNTPHRLEFDAGKFWVVSGSRIVEAEYTPLPAYFDKKNSLGTEYKDMIVTHSDRARISPVQGGCAIACTFCNLPYENNYRKHPAPQLVDAVHTAINDSLLPAQHLLISGGTPKSEDFAYEKDVYKSVKSTFPGLDVDIMMAPAITPDGSPLLDLKELKDLGIHGLSINLEVFNPVYARKIIPGKFKMGKDHYISFMEAAVQEFGIGAIRSILMIGIEPIDDTLGAVQLLAERGISPELSPLRPDPTTPLRNAPIPAVEFQKEIYQRARDIVGKYPGVYMGERCIPCMHNVLNFPDMPGYYYPKYDTQKAQTSYSYIT